MTALTATPQASATPARVLLAVTGAPNPPANAYASNFTAGVDSWTASGTGASVPWASGDSWLTLQGASGSPVGNVITASRVVTGLTVGAVYRLRVTATRNDPNAGNTRLRITGGAAGAYLTVPVGGNGVLDLTFTPTATSHTINVDQQRTTDGVAGTERVFILSVTVQPAGTWQGTTVRRTDANGTDRVVREDIGGLDTAGGTMTLYDLEAALTGPVSYTVTDGTGGTATAVTSFTTQRLNRVRNPGFELGTTGWQSTNANASLSATMAPQLGAPITGARSGMLTCLVAGTIAAQYAPTLTDRPPVTPGETLHLEVKARASANLTASLDLSYYDAAGAAVGAYSAGAPTALPAGVDTVLSRDAVVPAGAAYVRPLAVVAGAAVGNTVLVDDAYAGAPGAYFDGDTANTDGLEHAWVGAPHASFSAETTAGTSTAQPWITLPATAAPSVGTIDALPLELVTGFDESSRSNGTLHTIINRADKVANPGPLSLRSGTLTLWARDYATARAVRDLLQSGEIAQLRQPTFPGLDAYLYPTSVRIAPETFRGQTRRWVVELAYDEVLAP